MSKLEQVGQDPEGRGAMTEGRAWQVAGCGHLAGLERAAENSQRQAQHRAAFIISLAKCLSHPLIY